MTQQSDTTYDKPLPLLQGMAQEFYNHCKNGELRFQRCSQCGKWRHVPRAMCAACGSWQWEWARSSGRGKVFTWTVVRRPMHPGFSNDTPYAPVVVELAEGVRMVTWLVDVAPDEIRRDMAVEVVFDAVTPEVTLPKFRKVKS
ncbi:MAG: Zn-ribbon domain-containing OB-fold protein [Deltaproteobacteria bacterium]|nr:Zn-ribbon domain-containing OB-fold protein [Deltaproteobacteria bacterium]